MWLNALLAWLNKLNSCPAPGVPSAVTKVEFRAKLKKWQFMQITTGNTPVRRGYKTTNLTPRW
jgi:hypothetical protein